MVTKQIPLIIIVAATTKNGIGKNNALPWPMLKKEMGYFARVTKRVPEATTTETTTSPNATKRNAVIMGRKTWDSIPTKFRPLKDRANVVISSQTRDQLGAIPQDVVVAPDVLSGLETLNTLVEQGQSAPIGRAFVIGGSSIYKKALELPQTGHILLTQIKKDYDCDTFFPESLGEDSTPQSGWQRRSLSQLREFVGEDVPDGFISEKGDGEEVQFEYQLYERS